MNHKITLLSLLLGCASLAVAQPVASYDRTEHDFGTILWKQPASTTFTVTNRGNRPLVITYVSTDCGCTDAEWTQTAIAAGEVGQVTVTFDAGMLGRFHKYLGIYSNADEEPVYLALRGTVASELKDYGETHPYQIGNLRLDRRSVRFADGHKGDSLVAEVNVVNTGESDYAPSLIHSPSHVSMKCIPDTLTRHQAGRLRFTIDSERLTHLGLTQTSVNLSRFMGDKISEENELQLEAILLPDFSRLTAAQRALAPVLMVSAERLDFGPFGEKKKLTQTVVLTNTGKSTLKIQALQVSDLALSVSLKKSELKPGESTRLKVTAVRELLKKRKSAEASILMITNAPGQPKTEITTNLKR